MSERTSGFYRLVTFPKVYAAFQNILGGVEARAALRDDFFSDVANKRVLEVGCGPGVWLPQMAGAGYYLGMDWNARHISRAQETHGAQNIEFKVGDVSQDISAEDGRFDYIFAFGILHHLNDGQTSALLSICAALLDKNGRFLSIDPVYHEGQHRFAKWMCDRDSGQDIREAQGYGDLAAPYFDSVETTICTDKLRIPYSHCVMIAQAGS